MATERLSWRGGANSIKHRRTNQVTKHALPINRDSRPTICYAAHRFVGPIMHRARATRRLPSTCRPCEMTHISG